MGFSRLGTAVPLEESASLLAFDTNVLEVLESLRAAQQPASSLEVWCIREGAIVYLIQAVSAGNEAAVVAERGVMPFSCL